MKDVSLSLCMIKEALSKMEAFLKNSSFLSETAEPVHSFKFEYYWAQDKIRHNLFIFCIYFQVFLSKSSSNTVFSWHLSIDSFSYMVRNLHKLLLSYLIICASLIKCLYIDNGSSHIKTVFVKDARICFYWDKLFTCSSHLHWPHSVSSDIQIVLKGIYVLT